MSDREDRRNMRGKIDRGEKQRENKSMREKGRNRERVEVIIVRVRGKLTSVGDERERERERVIGIYQPPTKCKRKRQVEDIHTSI